MNSYSYHIARQFIRRRNAEHLGRFPQLACFAFDAITLSLHLDGQYERGELEFLAERIFPTLPPGSACLDIGANIGNHSLHFARHFARVIAFEPHPRTFRLLALNAELADNVTALNCGASSAAGEVAVVENLSNIGASSLHHSAGDAGRQVTFRLQRIDDLPEVQSCGPIAFVKIDVEGHEAEAIAGAAATFARHRPLVALEVLGTEVRAGGSAAVDALRQLGYRHFYELVDRGPLARLPRRIGKWLRALASLLSGRRGRRHRVLREVHAFAARNYPMVLCSVDPLSC